MDDQDILKRIQKLVDEESALREGGELDRIKKERHDSLAVQLDQCWDLLRQRRGMRHAGVDPENAEVRDPNVVEHYKQ